MREDAQKLIKAEGMRYVGATRKVVDAAVGALPDDVAVLAVLAGQAKRYHPLVPAPEQCLGSIAVCDAGVAVALRPLLKVQAYFMAWDGLVRAQVSLSGMSGVLLDVATEEMRVVLSEQFRGPISKTHADAVSAAFQTYLSAR